jgi:alkyl sulfatase BDS1-like metallo-beta-lactamase superfamily hydrolase
MRPLTRIAGFTLFVTMLLTATTMQAQDTEATKKLKARSQELREDIIKIADNVYTSVGHTVSTVSMIIGDDGLIIIDAGQMAEKSQLILDEFRKISDKPIKAIVLTHGHGDHTGGLSVYTAEGKPDIWGRDNFGAEGFRTETIGLRAINGAWAAGMLLPPEKRINNGVAPAHYPPRFRQRPAGTGQRAGGQRAGAAQQGGGPVGQLYGTTSTLVNRTFSEDRKTITVSGITLELVKAPGETGDQLYVWYPEKRVVFAGDNFYRSFPNIYPLRGVARRSAVDWAESVDKMLKEKPLHLVGGHTRPFSGTESEIAGVLTNYRDAIQIVFDKTVEAMNNGLTMREAVEYVQLPERLAKLDYLGEYYGKISFVVQDIWVQNRGWFDGNSTSLDRLSPKEEARRIADLAGGQAALLQKAQQALKAGEYQWAAQLADYLLLVDENAREPQLIRAEAFEALGEHTWNAPSRNQYLTEAQEIRKALAGQ